MTDDRKLQAAIAVHRFGPGESSLEAASNDPQAWLLSQIGPADPAPGDGLLDVRGALLEVSAAQEARKTQAGAKQEIRDLDLADARSHLAAAATTRRPFAERLTRFWANHFTVSLAKGSTRGLAGPFEREAIRPHIAGNFETMLFTAVSHPAMLRYLDNVASAGPHSKVVERSARRAREMEAAPRITGLNENLAREMLELHTLGAESARSGVYTQADVSALAAVLTGWRVAAREPGAGMVFDAAWHEPGDKTVLGRRYPEGAEALRRVCHDLAHHPATARFVATKLARHFVADEPPPALVERLTDTWLRHDAELAAVTRALVRSPEAWSPQPSKLKTPEEFVVSVVRVLGANGPSFGLGEDAGRRPDLDEARRRAAGAALGAAVTALGQRPLHAPSPAGWSDLADDWLGPEAVWKRVEWSTRVADRLGRRVDARALAADSLGPWLSEATRTQIDRAADGPQALALLLMAPEFQRR